MADFPSDENVETWNDKHPEYVKGYIAGLKRAAYSSDLANGFALIGNYTASEMLSTLANSFESAADMILSTTDDSAIDEFLKEISDGS